MDYKTFQNIKNLRPIARDELVLDCDDRENGDLALRQIGLLLSADSYQLEVYKAEGQKSYHLHIKKIPHIAELPKEQNKLYKELLIKKYISQAINLLGCTPAYFDKLDFSLCVPDHLVAEENKPHFKYKTTKQLITIVNDDCINFCDYEIYEQVTGKEKSFIYNPDVTGTGITAQIIKQVSIIEIARQFGLNVNAQGFAVCPFHADSKPSLKFYENQGRFICFGCNTKGNIIDFYVFLKRLNPKFKYTKNDKKTKE